MKFFSDKLLVFSFLLIGFFCLYYSYAKPRLSNAEVINQIMSYQMPHIILRCKKDFNYSDEDMKIIEKEFKRFIIMSIINKDTAIGMYSKDIDNLWHTFILFNANSIN